MIDRERRTARVTALGLLASALVLATSACSKGENTNTASPGAATAANTTATPAPSGAATTPPAAPGGAPAAPSATPPAAPGAAPAANANASDITPAMVAEGDSIFHGKLAGGLCFSCHGPDGKGTPTAPDLTDNQWLNGDGSYGFMIGIVTNGVPQPKQHPAPMPPMGGAQLSQQQIRAVAAYEYSLSHKIGH